MNTYTVNFILTDKHRDLLDIKKQPLQITVVNCMCIFLKFQTSNVINLKRLSEPIVGGRINQCVILLTCGLK